VSRSPGRDLLVGVFVLLGIGALAYLSLAVGGLSRRGPNGFLLTADFDELGGLKTRAPVVISGVKVGQVRSIALGDDYRAHVTLDLDPQLHLPKDTSASIVTAGLLGDRYISLQLGGDPAQLKSGDAIAFTESAVLLERLLGKLVHSTDVAGNGEKQE
jgi:phospholipid/cholesterol/gamma-HCH transport system substrate-binding protein